MLPDLVQLALLNHYNTDGRIRVYSMLTRSPPEGANLLKQTAQFLNYALLDGRRITPLSRSQRESAGSSIICINWQGRTHSGEVLNIFEHNQYILGSPMLFAEIRWMKQSAYSPVDDNPWLGL